MFTYSITDSRLDKQFKIQGTNFDRHRKVPVELIPNIIQDRYSGMALREVAEKYQISVTAVRYYCDPEVNYKMRHYKCDSHKNKLDRMNRINYKKNLLLEGCVCNIVDYAD